MGSNESRIRSRIDSALLFLSRDPAQLSCLLEWFLPPQSLSELATAGGRRRAGRLQPSLAIAEMIEKHPKLRRSVATALMQQQPDAEPLAAPESDSLDGVEPQRLLASLYHALIAAHLSDWQEIPPMMDRFEKLLQAAEGTSASSPSAGKAQPAPKPAAPTALDPLDKLKQQLSSLRSENASLQKALGKEHRRKQELLEQLEAARSERRIAVARATELKKQLAESSDVGQREQLLIDEATDARREQRIAEQKLELLVFERDDLRACLEDLDHFDSLAEEEVPSFRNRPLLDKENQLAKALEECGRSFKVLVIGGGEPQHRHLDKLEEYAEVMGFESDWRMAEYVSWHKEMNRLGTDMNTRFDALVILHWNRTTFTRKAREICNEAGHKPCITCYYEGFTSLRETLQECLRQLIAASS
ncbi:MAG: hypothetical protein QF489_05890 [Planctomycetota bacterium]|jgi:hypothetical protein|nr:hypothetical protein [Planctomycetota bacterium]